MAMQLTDALLAIEEERAIWSTTEKTSIEVIENKSKLYSAEIALLTDTLSEVRNELEACREECETIKQKLAFAEEKVDQKNISEDVLKSKLETLSFDHRNACEEVDKLQMDLNALSKERDDMAANGREFDKISVLMDDIQAVRKLNEAKKLESSAYDNADFGEE